MTKEERNAIYKKALRILRYKNENEILSPGICLCLYFQNEKFEIEDFPELIRHKPPKKKTYNFWFTIINPNGFTIRENILLQAIKETE